MVFREVLGANGEQQQNDNVLSDVGEILKEDGDRAIKEQVVRDGEIWSWTNQNHTLNRNTEHWLFFYYFDDLRQLREHRPKDDQVAEDLADDLPKRMHYQLNW